jgi:hypothetical protein
MLVVMDLHRLGIDVRLERIKGVWERGYGKCHQVSCSNGFSLNNLY